MDEKKIIIDIDEIGINIHNVPKKQYNKLKELYPKFESILNTCRIIKVGNIVFFSDLIKEEVIDNE